MGGNLGCSRSGWFVRVKYDKRGNRLFWVGHKNDPDRQRVQLRGDLVRTQEDAIALLAKCAGQLERGIEDVYPHRDKLICEHRGLPETTRARSLKPIEQGQPDPVTKPQDTDKAAEDKQPTTNPQARRKQVAKKPAAASVPASVPASSSQEPPVPEVGDCDSPDQSVDAETFMDMGLNGFRSFWEDPLDGAM